MTQLSPAARARDLGAPTYHGMPCRHCGGTERKTVNNDCSRCNRERSRVRRQEQRAREMTPWKVAKLAGLKTYQGRQCEDCGGTERYVSGKSCVGCAAARVAAYRARKAGEQPTPRTRIEIAEPERPYEPIWRALIPQQGRGWLG